jgi:hypothetical protein
LADAAHAAERAEQDAARAAVAAGMRRLTVTHLTPRQIAALSGLSPNVTRDLPGRAGPSGVP